MTHENWMAQLPDHLRQVPITELAIPGTHDSGTFDIDMDSGAAPDLQSNLKKLKKYTCCVGQKFIVSWSITQSASFIPQLTDGIRYFDMRLGYDSKSKDLWLVHGLLSCTLRTALQEIRSFVSTHPNEVVLLDFNHFYAMDQNMHAIASQLILQYLDDYLYPQPYPTVKFPSVKDCVDAKANVLVFYKVHVPDMPFWGGYYVLSPWGNKNDVKDLLGFLTSQYTKSRPSNRLYVTQGVLTPDTSYVAKHPFSSIRGMADDVNPAFINWLKTKKAGPNGVNVCMVDYFQDYEVVPTVLALNK